MIGFHFQEFVIALSQWELQSVIQYLTDLYSSLFSVFLLLRDTQV